MDALNDLEMIAEKSTVSLGAHIDAFTKATDASTRQLAKWTMVTAVATIVLAVFTPPTPTPAEVRG